MHITKQINNLGCAFGVHRVQKNCTKYTTLKTFNLFSTAHLTTVITIHKLHIIKYTTPGDQKMIKASHRAEKHFRSQIMLIDDNFNEVLTMRFYIPPSGAVSCCVWINNTSSGSHKEPSNNQAGGYCKQSEAAYYALEAAGVYPPNFAGQGMSAVTSWLLEAYPGTHLFSAHA